MELLTQTAGSGRETLTLVPPWPLFLPLSQEKSAGEVRQNGRQAQEQEALQQEGPPLSIPSNSGTTTRPGSVAADSLP